jgi:hypothetical protein
VAFGLACIAPLLIHPLLPIDPLASVISNNDWAFFPGLEIIISFAVVAALSLPIPENIYSPFIDSWKSTLLWLAIFSISLYGSGWCFRTHVCMAGHGCHGMTALGRMIDTAWIIGLIVAAIGAAFTRSHVAVMIAYISGFVISFRFVFGSLGGVFPNL